MYKEKHSPAWMLQAIAVSNAVFCVYLSSYSPTHYCLACFPGTAFFLLPARLSCKDQLLFFPAKEGVAYAQTC